MPSTVPRASCPLRGHPEVESESPQTLSPRIPSRAQARWLLCTTAQYDPWPFLGLVQGSAHPWEGAVGRLIWGRSEGVLDSAASEAL